MLIRSMPYLVLVHGLNILISICHLECTLADELSLHKHLVDWVYASVTFNPTHFGTYVAAPQDAGTFLTALSSIREIPVRMSKNVRLNANIDTVVLPHHVATGVKDLKDCHKDIKHVLETEGHSVLKVDMLTRPPCGRRRYEPYLPWRLVCIINCLWTHRRMLFLNKSAADNWVAANDYYYFASKSSSTFQLECV